MKIPVKISSGSWSFLFFLLKPINPHCAESPILAMKKNIFDKFQPILG
jgi:hypothetical protein